MANTHIQFACMHACFYKRTFRLTHIHAHSNNKTSMSTYQLQIKKMKLQLAVLFISALLRESIAMPAVDHCLIKFEDSLKETMALRRSCEEANLKDCCQVRY